MVKIPLILDSLNGLVMFILLLNKKYSNNLNKFIIFCILLYCTGRITKSTRVVALYHSLWALLMLLLPFYSNDKLILACYIVVIILTITTRKIFKFCIIRSLEKKTNKLTNNKFVKKMDWDYIFPLLGIKATEKLYNL